VLSVLFKPRYVLIILYLWLDGRSSTIIYGGWCQLDIESVRYSITRRYIQYVWASLVCHLKHILSKDGCLQFSYSSVFFYYSQKNNNVTVHGSRPPPEVPDNQSSILGNDQGGQNNVINDSFQQTTQLPTSFPETMVSTHA